MLLVFVQSYNCFLLIPLQVSKIIQIEDFDKNSKVNHINIFGILIRWKQVYVSVFREKNNTELKVQDKKINAPV